MSKQAGFDSELFVGTQQTEYAIIVCDTDAGITVAGNSEFVITAAGMSNTPKTVVVALAEDDLPADVVTKAAAALNLDADVKAWMVAYAVGINLYVRLIEAATNDGTLNIAYADAGTCEGLTDDNASEIGVGGVAEVETANVKNLGGPSLSVDTEDVTTHDQATAFEELVATIIRSGEVPMDLVFDPAHATHDASTGLTYRLEDKIYSFFKLIFPDDTEWEFSGYVIGFEPQAPVDGALTAAVKLKITSQPTLA